MELRRTGALDRRGRELQQVGFEPGFDWQAPQAPRRRPDMPDADAYHLPDFPSHTVAGRASAGPAYPQQSAAAAPAATAAGIDDDGFHLPRHLRRHDASSTQTRRRWMLPRGLGAPFAGHQRPSLALALVVGFAALCGGLTFNVLTDGGRTARTQPSLLPDLDRIAFALGLGLDQVTLTGQRYTGDGEVFDALDLANARSFLRFDALAARERIERLPWVASADIKRVFPGRLDVRIAERTPFALWHKGDKHILVDRSGRELSAANAADHATLPRLAGEGAPTEAAQLLDLLQRYPLIASRLTRADRVDGRRWTLRLTGDVVLHLPADREALALDAVAGGANLARLLAAGGRVIDLRSAGRLAVRRAPSSIKAADAAGPE